MSCMELQQTNKQFLMRAGESPHACMIWPSIEETGKKKSLLPVFPWKGLNYTFPQMLPQHSASNQPSLQVLNVILPFRTLTVLGTHSTTESHQEQRKWLGLLQRLEKQSEAQAGQIDKIHLLHKTTLPRMGWMAILPNVPKPAQRIMENKETEECVPPKK